MQIRLVDRMHLKAVASPVSILQVSNEFDSETVQRQLRYTGMLETVRIRQAGYNVRFTYDEFIQLYRILLPKGLLRYLHNQPFFIH
jgi:myosin heavy subunit